jgi:peptide-methionine (R)-S-oxide reductase
MGWFSGAKAATVGKFRVNLTEDEWRKRLKPDQFSVLRKHATERPRSSPLDKVKAAGTFKCAGCAWPLFRTSDKFDSGTGWPSFTRPLNAKAVGTQVDRSLFMSRMEVHCANCGGHLGHVFPDGPPPTGKRYCMNGAAMTFQAA